MTVALRLALKMQMEIILEWQRSTKVIGQIMITTLAHGTVTHLRFRPLAMMILAILLLYIGIYQIWETLKTVALIILITIEQAVRLPWMNTIQIGISMALIIMKHFTQE